MLWIGTNEGLWRIDESEKDELDRVQCFRADACMFDNNVKAVEPDGSDGVWVLTESGVSHIEMRMLSVEHKANLHSSMDERIVQRRGMLSGTDWSAERNRWVPHESDNDGLWTALVAMGDICRYGVMKNDPKYTPEQVEHARKVATAGPRRYSCSNTYPHGRAKSRRSSATTSRVRTERQRATSSAAGRAGSISPMSDPQALSMLSSAPSMRTTGRSATRCRR